MAVRREDMHMTGDGRAERPEQHRSLPGRMFDAVVGSVVSPVVDAVDVDQVLDDVDINALLDRIDVNALLDRVEPNALLDRVDADRLLDRVDPNRLLDRVDPDRLLDRVDADRLLDRIGVDRLVARLDVDALLDRVDVDALVDRIDVPKVVDRVDVNGVVERIDVDALMERVDVNRLLDRTELKAIIARSTTGVFSGVIDVARTQIITIDQTAQGLGAFVMRRPRGEAPGTPSEPSDRPELRSIGRRERAVALQGHYAGSVSRFLAFLVDMFAVGLLFGLGSALVASAIEVVFRTSVDAADHRLLVTALYVGWAFLYFAGSWATTGRTFGMALLGVMVVRADGADLGIGRAAARTVCFPLGFLIFGAGLVIGLFRRDRRELHDLLAGTCVIHAWDAEEAQLRADAVAAAHPALAARRPAG
jgi:uncharacterized RDD family membrane protein YckC